MRELFLPSRLYSGGYYNLISGFESLISYFLNKTNCFSNLMSGFSDLLTEFLKVISRFAYPHILLTLPVVGLVWLRVLRVSNCMRNGSAESCAFSNNTLRHLFKPPNPLFMIL